MASATTKVERFVDQPYQNDFMKSMHKLRQNKEYTDVTLQSGDVQIQCHRNVLAVASDYLKAMFKCGLKESTSESVQLTMEPELLPTIVDYIYTGEIELTVDSVENLIKACDVLQLDTLKAACENVMLKQVEPANCIGFYKFSALYRLNQLQQNARRMMKSEFKTVAFVEEFKELSCAELIECIKDDDVNVEDEDVVFDAVLGWVRHDLVNRKSSLETILEHVRLPYCSRNYLRHIKDKVDLLTAKCFEYLHEAMAFQIDIVHQNEITSCRTLPRTNFRMKSCLLVVGGLTTGHDEYNDVEYNDVECNDVECNDVEYNEVEYNDADYNGDEYNDVEYTNCQYYDEDSSCWKSLTALPESVGRVYSVCCVEGGLLLTGGYKRGVVNQCWLFDFGTKKWEAMPPLKIARWYHHSVSQGECVYVVGGMGVGDNNVLKSVECLNLKRREWSSMPNMPQAVSHPMVVTYGSKVFVFGGRDTQGRDLCCTQVFDTKHGSWSIQSNSPTVCSFGAAVTLNDCIFVVGGFRRTCLKYDPASDSWKILSQPQHQHGNAPAVVWRGSILIAGGGDDKLMSSVIEEYEPLTDTWCSCTIASLNEKLRHHCMFNIDLHSV